MDRSVSTRRRGSVSLAAIIVLALLQIAVIAVVLSGSRDQNTMVARMASIRAFYAAEAGMNMAIREVRMGTDCDGDGHIGGVSDDGLAANNPALSGGAKVTVSATVSGSTMHLVADSQSGVAYRSVAAEFQSGSGAFGNSVPLPNWSMWSAKNTQIATRATLAVSGTLTAISAYMWGSPGQFARCAIYADSSGQPGALVVQSAPEQFGSSQDHWVSLSVPPTVLAPGTYWLAVSSSTNGMSYYFSAGGQSRVRNHNAVDNGFLANWGTSDQTRSETISIYGTLQSNAWGSGARVRFWAEQDVN